MSRARAEIAEQPAVVGALLEREREPIERLAAEVRRRRPRYAVVAARGSSDNAARYAQHALGRLAGHRIALPPGSPLAGLRRRVILGIRPTDFELVTPTTDPALPRMRVTVDVVEKLGSESHLIFAVDAPRVSTDAVQAARDAEGADEGVLLADDQRSEFTARIDGRQSVDPGATVELAVDHRALHAFDVESGLALRAEVPERPLAATA